MRTKAIIKKQHTRGRKKKRREEKDNEIVGEERV